MDSGNGGTGSSGNRGRGGRGRGRGGRGGRGAANNVTRRVNGGNAGGGGGGGGAAPAPAPAPVVAEDPHIRETKEYIQRWINEVFMPGVQIHNAAVAVKLSFRADPTTEVARTTIAEMNARIEGVINTFHMSLRGFTFERLVFLLSDRSRFQELEDRYTGIIQIIKDVLYSKLGTSIVRTSVSATGRRGSFTCASELSRQLFMGPVSTPHWGGWVDLNLISLLSSIKYFNFLGLTQHLQCRRVTSQAEFDSPATAEFKGPGNSRLTAVIMSNRHRSGGGHSFSYVRDYTGNWLNADDVHGILIPRNPNVPPSWTTPGMFGSIEAYPTSAMLLVSMPSTRAIIAHAGTTLQANIMSNILTTGQQKAPERFAAFTQFTSTLASHPFIGFPLFLQGGSGTCVADSLSSVLAFSDGLMYVTYDLYIKYIKAIIDAIPTVSFSQEATVRECSYQIASRLSQLRTRPPAASETQAVMDGYIRGTHAAGAGGNVLPAAAPAGLAVQNITHYVKQDVLQQNAAGVSQSHRLWVMEPLPALDSGIQGVSLEYQARSLRMYALVFIRLHFLLFEGVTRQQAERDEGIRRFRIGVNNRGPHPPPPPNAGGGGGGGGGGP